MNQEIRPDNCAHEGKNLVSEVYTVLRRIAGKRPDLQNVALNVPSLHSVGDGLTLRIPNADFVHQAETQINVSIDDIAISKDGGKWQKLKIFPQHSARIELNDIETYQQGDSYTIRMLPNYSHSHRFAEDFVQDVGQLINGIRREYNKGLDRMGISLEERAYEALKPPVHLGNKGALSE